jgi:DNA-binding transcriptional ArsR family regulator
VKSSRAGAAARLEYLTNMLNIVGVSRRTRTRRRAPVASANQLDLLFSALGDRTRRALLARLARSPAIVTELAAPFDLSLPAVSRHIRVLEAAGLVRRTVEGRIHRCALAAEPLRTADAWLQHYRHFWDSNLEALAQYVES